MLAVQAATLGSHASGMLAAAPQRPGQAGRAVGHRLPAGTAGGHRRSLKLAPRATGKDKQAQETVTGVVFEPFKGDQGV